MEDEPPEHFIEAIKANHEGKSNPEEDVEPYDTTFYETWGGRKNSKETGLFVQDHFGVWDILPYCDFRRARGLFPNIGVVVFTHTYIIFNGINISRKDLLEFAIRIQDQKIRYIKAYNTKFFDPPDPNSRIITHLEVRPRKKNDPIEILMEEIAKKFSPELVN